MRRRIAPPAALEQLARLQGGVVSREQVLGHGLGKDVLVRLARDSWTPLAPGVYLTHRGELPWLGAAWTGVLLGGPGSMLAGEAAGHLHGLVATPPHLIEVVIPPSTRRVDVDRWRFARRVRRGRGEPPHTLLDDTVLDLCRDLEPDAVISLLADVVSSRRTSPALLLATLGERTRYRHRDLLHELLGEVADGVHSPLERRYLHDVERAHGLPCGRRQAPLAGGRSDVLYEEFAVVVELDGRLGHQGSGRFRDLLRDNRNALHALTTLRFGHADETQHPCEVADVVATALASRGWNDPSQACRRCRRRPGQQWH